MNRYERWIKSYDLNFLLVVLCVWIPATIGEFTDAILGIVYGWSYTSIYVVGYASIGMTIMLIGEIIVFAFIIIGAYYLPTEKAR